MGVAATLPELSEWTLPLSFEVETSIMMICFLSSAVGKIYKIRTNKRRELEAPWLI